MASLVPKLRLEMIATRSDTTKLAWLAESPCPTMILVGEKTLAPHAVARQLQSALGAALVIVPGAAHMIPITRKFAGPSHGGPAVVNAINLLTDAMGCSH